jgi:peptidoglycan/LPS O-acetylase OafA/YrhL
MSIVLTHAAVYAGMEQPGTFVGPYVSRLNCGVTIFFLISGFLLYRPFFLERINGEPQMDTKAYAWRRFLRITPAYWVALTITGIWVGLPHVFTPTGIPTFYGFFQVYRDNTALHGISQAWSLCVEVAFYALLPLWALLMRRLRARDERTMLRQELIGLAALFVLATVWKLGFLQYGTRGVVTDVPMIVLPSQLDLFSLGMLLAVLSVWYERRGGLPGLLRPLDRFPIIGWLIAFAAFMVAARGLGLSGETFEPFSKFQYLAQYYLFAAIAFGLLLPAVFGDQQRGFVRRHILANRGLMYLGLVSYGIYLWHQTVFTQLYRWHLQDHHIVHQYFPWVFFGIPATVAIASLSYYVVERPALRLKGLVGRRPAHPEEAVGEPAPLAPVAQKT